MARIHPTVHISGTDSIPMDAFVGTAFSDRDFGRTWQDDPVFQNGMFAEEERLLEERFIKPLDTIANQILATRKRMDVGLDVWRDLSTIDDLYAIPPCMEEMIAMYAPVRKLAEQGRIRCFGLDLDELPKNDFYGRITDNFTCEDVAASLDKHEQYHYTAEVYSDDPELSVAQQHMIWKARRTVDLVLQNTKIDPTDPAVLRG